VAGNAHVSGADWSPGEEILYYSAAASATDDDLFQITANGQSNQNLTSTTGQRERRPRFNLGGTALAFERVDANGRGQIWIATSLGLRTLTPAAPAGEALANTPYVVGSEADPVFSPDSKFVLYRQLVATGNGGLGQWSFMTIRTDVTNATPTVLLSGGGRLPRRGGLERHGHHLRGDGVRLRTAARARRREWRRAQSADDGGHGVRGRVSPLAQVANIPSS
jgi:hypothetical protein